MPIVTHSLFQLVFTSLSSSQEICLVSDVVQDGMVGHTMTGCQVGRSIFLDFISVIITQMYHLQMFSK